jgi:hypothetical protein
MAQQARQNFARLIEEQPILMAALGAALGAAVGAALPLSQSEKDLMGSTGAKAIDIGRGALANTADVVRKEASAADVGAKMGQLADTVRADRHQGRRDRCSFAQIVEGRHLRDQAGKVRVGLIATASRTCLQRRSQSCAAAATAATKTIGEHSLWRRASAARSLTRC